jgi:membrane-bound inhibitor of C-type lysozyme
MAKRAIPRFLAGAAACMTCILAPAANSLAQSEQAPPVAKSHLRQALPRREYACVGGIRISVLLESREVRLISGGRVYNLKRVESASGEKYSDRTMVWSTKGDEGFLEDGTDAANPKIVAKDCRLESTYPPSTPLRSIKGSVNFTAATLPPNAELRITLVDLKHEPGGHAQDIGVTSFNIPGRRPPIPFELRFDPATASSRSCCAMGASVLVDGKIRYTTSKLVVIPDLSHPPAVALDLAPVN